MRTRKNVLYLILICLLVVLGLGVGLRAVVADEPTDATVRDEVLVLDEAAPLPADSTENGADETDITIESDDTAEVADNAADADVEASSEPEAPKVQEPVEAEVVQDELATSEPAIQTQDEGDAAVEAELPLETEVLAASEESGTGYIGEPFPALSIHDANESRGVSPQGGTRSSLPAKYDSRDYGYITSVKDQSRFGTCWAFGSISAMEASLLRHGQVSDAASLDFSERHLAYFTYHEANDPLGNIAGDRTIPGVPTFGNDAGNDKYLHVGGNTTVTVRTLASWKGLVNENDVPTYSDLLDSYNAIFRDAAERQESPTAEDFNQFYKDTALPESLAYGNNSWILSNAYYIKPSDRNDMKQAIMEHGAVSASIHLDDYYQSIEFYKYGDQVSKYSFSTKNKAYFNHGYETSNHLITIVGWDDNFSKEKFLTEPYQNWDAEYYARQKKPSSDGAWLVKNSWGTRNNWAIEQDGYFWLSYEDAALNNTDADPATAFVLAPASKFDNIYQYDGGTSWWYDGSGVPSGSSYANVFEVKANEGGAEELRSVGFGISYDVNVDYSIQVYTHLTDDKDPTSGIAAFTKPVTGKTTYAGYYSVDLPTPVYLDEDSKYSIVITVSHADASLVKFDVDVTENVSSWIRWETSEEPGQSFDRHGTSGPWNDLAYINTEINHKHQRTARIKGHTVNVEAKPSIAAATVSVEDRTYNGKAQEPAPVVKMGNTTLKVGTDYVVTQYEDNVNAGIATVTISGKGNYAGTANKTFKINPASIEKASVANVADQEWTGSPIKPTPAVKLGSTTLKKDTDYTLSYENNVKVGTATIAVTGEGNYTGTATKTFKIVDPTVAVTSVAVSGNKSMEAGKTQTLKATVKPDNATSKSVTWKSSDTDVATVDAGGKVTAKKAGTATITATAKDGSKKAGSIKITVSAAKPKTVAVTSVKVTGTAAMNPGATQTLKATVAPTNATNKAVTWKSSNTGVATVDANGKVTAKKAGTTTITATAKDGSKKAGTFKITVRTPSISYRTHVQMEGWQNFVKDGAMSGTSGKAYRLEGIEIKLANASGGISYRTHVQNIGWQNYVSNGKMAGTSGRALRLEAIEIYLTGEIAKYYDVYYRVHCQNIGWMGWAKGAKGSYSGTAGYAYRLEGIQIVLVPKGNPAPAATYKGITQVTKDTFRQKK